MGYDQIFRNIIIAFSADFVRLTLPDLAERIDLEGLRFELVEHFSHGPKGRVLRPDLVAMPPPQGDSEAEHLLHVEVESCFYRRRIPGFWDYNRALGLAKRCPIVTVVLYLKGGPAGLSEQTFEVNLHGRQLTTFTYTTLSLASCLATEYLARPEPLAWAFAALMRPSTLGNQVAVRIACLERIITHRNLDENHRFLLVNLVQTYIESDQAHSEEYEQLLARAENKEVKKAMVTWAEKMKAEGRQEGRQEERTVVLSGLRTMVAKLASQRFGSLPRSFARRLREIESPRELMRLAERITASGSLDELGKHA